MRLFFGIIAIVCFVYNFTFAAVFHTMIELQAAANDRGVRELLITPASLKRMTLAELTEIEI